LIFPRHQYRFVSVFQDAVKNRHTGFLLTTDTTQYNLLALFLIE